MITKAVHRYKSTVLTETRLRLGHKLFWGEIISGTSCTTKGRKTDFKI